MRRALCVQGGCAYGSRRHQTQHTERGIQLIAVYPGACTAAVWATHDGGWNAR